MIGVSIKPAGFVKQKRNSVKSSKIPVSMVNLARSKNLVKKKRAADCLWEQPTAAKRKNVCNLII